MLPVRRTLVGLSADPSGGVEISEAKLAEMIDSVLAAGEHVGPIRRAMRVPVEGFARIRPPGGNQ
jgi:hypothetical protein